MSEPIKVTETLSAINKVFDFKENLVDRDLRGLEDRLNRKIDKIETDLNTRIDRFERNIKWFVGIGLCFTAIIVRLLFLI